MGKQRRHIRRSKKGKRYVAGRRKRIKRRGLKPGMKIPVLKLGADWQGIYHRDPTPDELPILYWKPGKQIYTVPKKGLDKEKMGRLRFDLRSTVFAESFKPIIDAGDVEGHRRLARYDPLLKYEEHLPHHKLKITPFMEKLPMRKTRKRYRR